MIDKFLIPYECIFPKIRMGSDNDGGYVIVDNGIEKYTGMVSMGICDDNNFEAEFHKKSNCYIQQYDYSINEPPSDIPNSDFFKIKVESSADLVQDERLGNKQFLKMDIEGSEWDLLPTMNLQQYEQIACELHFPNGFRLDALEHLIKSHNIVHVHGNACVPSLLSFINENGKIGFLPQYLELTLLRKDIGEFRPNETLYPTPLDQSCDRGRQDIDLRMHPFMPYNN